QVCSLDISQLDVNNSQIVRVSLALLDCFNPGRDGIDMVALRLQNIFETFQDSLVIVDDEDALCYHDGTYLLRSSGISTVNVVPSPNLEVTLISPRCDSTNRLVTARPSPTPFSLVVNKGLNILALTSSEMPFPVS